MTPGKDELVFGRSDLEAAVAMCVRAGPPQMASRNFSSRAGGNCGRSRRRTAAADHRFNDIFVTIGVALFLAR
jgi:hypothetical protein